MEVQRMKSIKVSEEVHEELSTRKQGGESFDQVLRRELGLVPRTIEELSQVLPDLIKTAIDTLIHEYIDTDGRYKRIGHKDEEKLVLEFVSQETHKSIFEVAVYLPHSGERVNHRVDLRHRNPQNKLVRVLRLRDTEEGTVDIEYTDFETRNEKENNRRGDNAGERTVNELIGDHVQRFVDQSYEVWGETSEPQDSL